jgi:hypothetical protein
MDVVILRCIPISWRQNIFLKVTQIQENMIIIVAFILQFGHLFILKFLLRSSYSGEGLSTLWRSVSETNTYKIESPDEWLGTIPSD